MTAQPPSGEPPPSPLLPLSGYVLAGGRSSRMGTDKALLELGGQTLAARAVAKLASICHRVRIVGSQPELTAFAPTPTVPDNLPGCGPLGGIEAALRDSAHDSACDWVMLLPVDLPFVPRNLLYQWASDHLRRATPTARIAYLEAGGYPQPLLALLHRSLLPEVQAALRAAQYRILGLYQQVARAPAEAQGATGSPEDSQRVLRAILRDYDRLQHPSGDAIPWVPTPNDIEFRNQWFSNLNTPAELAQAKAILRETVIES